MLMKAIIILTVLRIGCKSEDKKPKKSWALVVNPLAHARPCKGDEDVWAVFEPGLPPEEENQYYLSVTGTLPVSSKVILQFDSEATVTLSERVKASAIIDKHGDRFEVKYFKNGYFNVNVKGPASGSIPYVKSLVINTAEYCEDPDSGYFDSLVVGNRDIEALSLSAPDDTCGKRKIDHTELIVSGQLTKPGDWPWHVALYRTFSLFSGTSLKYICGGTLLSKTLVLTAARCVSEGRAPVRKDNMNVILGKYNLIGGDTSSEERQIHEIIVHKHFDPINLNHDIALLKLSSEAVFNDYIQPACIWSKSSYQRLPAGYILGTVVGWGFNQTDSLSSQLQQAKMPKVRESVCLKSNPVFFTKLLTDRKFCAGYLNGTSACNGDSGGGFHIFVPDVPGDESPNAIGTWHVRGIVSTSVARYDAAICDPRHFVLFTDVAKYNGWIGNYMM